MKPMRPYFRIFKDGSDCFSKSIRSIVGLQKSFELVLYFLEVCRLQVK